MSLEHNSRDKRGTNCINVRILKGPFREFYFFLHFNYFSFTTQSQNANELFLFLCLCVYLLLKLSKIKPLFIHFVDSKVRASLVFFRQFNQLRRGSARPQEEPSGINNRRFTVHDFCSPSAVELLWKSRTPPVWYPRAGGDPFKAKAGTT